MELQSSPYSLFSVVRTCLFNLRFFLLPRILVLSLLLTGILPAVVIADDTCGWTSAVSKWKVKMHLTQIKAKTGVLQSGPDCTANYVLALNHVSDVKGEVTNSGGGSTSWTGSLTSTEVVNNMMDITLTGKPACSYGNVSFTEIGTGEGSQSEYPLIIDPGMGKYTISFPHTGVDSPFTYTSSQGAATYTVHKEINGAFEVDYPSMVLAESPSDPVTTLEFPLLGASPKIITGETSFTHQQYPEIPITWSWELTPDTGGGLEAELGAPSGMGKGNGGDMAPGAGYGSPTWTVNMANLNIFITDTPLWYKSPVGPAVEVSFSYNSKGVFNRFEPAGRNWQLNYESYLSSDPVSGDVTIYMPDGRRDLYTYNASTLKFTPPYRVFNELTVIRQGGIMEGSDYALTFPDGTVYIYKVPSGQLLWAFLTEIRDPHYPTDPSNKLTLTWVPLSGTPWGGKLTSITDALGRATTFFYNADNRISTIMDPFGRTSILGYDTNGNLTSIRDMGGYTASFTYDGCGTMLTMTTGNNKVTFTSGFNNLTVSDYMGSETFTLDPITGAASYLGANAVAGSLHGYAQTKTADGKNSDVTGYTSPEGLGFSYSYDPKGNLLTQTLQGASGNETSTFTYNSKGKVLSVVPPIGARTDITYAANGVDPLTVTQAGLPAIVATYNGTHDILTLTDRMGLAKTFTYNASGQPTSSLGAGILTSFSYNDSGNRQLASITRAGLPVGSYGYDSIGRLTSATDQNGFSLGRSFNNLDDLLSISYPDSSTISFTRSLSVPHLLDSMTDQAGRITRYSYNPHSQLIKISDPAGGQTRFTYDAAGHASQLVDPNDNVTYFSYNKDNRLVLKQFVDGSKLQFAYPYGRMTWSKNARGATATYSYDKNGNLLSVNYSDGTPGVTTVYDVYNRPTTVTDALGTHTIAYDASSRVTSIDGAWANDTLSFAYDALGRKTAMEQQGGLSISYTYDSLDRLTTLTGNGLTYSYNYRNNGTLLTSVVRSDGSKTEYSYTATMLRLQQLANFSPGSTALDSYSFSYDSLGQPVTETVTNGPALQFASPGSVPITANNLNQIASWNGSATAFVYDADGNMTKGLTGEGRSFDAAYDAENRLTWIQYTDGNGVVRRQEFSYGSDGYLGIRKSYANGLLSGEQRYLWHAGKLLQERDSTNAVVRDYLWGSAMRGGVGALLSLKQGGAVYQCFANPRGDVTTILNSSGAVAASYAYEPFGTTLAATGTLSQPLRYATRLYDEGTGLYYFGQRFYSPLLGRWLSRDPLAEMASINLYSYAANNPLTRIDPLGTDPDFSGLAPEHRAQAQAAYEAMQAKDAARNDTTVDKVNRTLGAAFKWVGDLFKKHPEETKFVVDKVVDAALDANEYTKKGKEINDKINKGIKLAEDIETMRAAIKDKDPASGLTMIKVGSDYTIGRIPVVGSAMSEVVVKAVETVETAPGGVKAMRNAGAKADEAYRSGK
ncbi:RHS repeat-associated core domain-containing protein [Trichlorobacter thiogenes]|uniref:RHS repeat-associated core domain-containing protein n=1 Tax=Trichlorobacter thiogenes TaxID=115783 RepID=A0A1T4PBG2_9BACT|nr:RHS repeat domain-containing protein [Trichlorobacter thiogenes]SJZ88697.1 RHS repeat-associated core domain-containing protein [Trichlorobacter thiogenes]